jgi:hypothetical protein
MGRYRVRIVLVHAILGFRVPLQKSGGADSHDRMDQPNKALNAQKVNFWLKDDALGNQLRGRSRAARSRTRPESGGLERASVRPMARAPGLGAG